MTTDSNSTTARGTLVLVPDPADPKRTLCGVTGHCGKTGMQVEYLDDERNGYGHASYRYEHGDVVVCETVRYFDAATAPVDDITGVHGPAGWYWRDAAGEWTHAPNGRDEAEHHASVNGAAR